MSILHAFIGAAWSYLAVAAVATLLARWSLRQRLDRLERPEAFDTPGVFLALVSTSLVPFVWLASSAIHSIEYGGFAGECCRWLTLQGPAWQQSLFATGALLLAGTQLVSTYRRWRRRHGSHDDSDEPLHRARRSVREVAADTPVIETHLEAIRVVRCPERICAVRGFLDPRIEISAGLVDELNTPALRAALLHEIAHLTHADPLRTSVALFAEVLNPFSHWLGRERRAWQFARELHCDRRALDYGVEPTHLADALVTVARARPERDSEHLCQLCGEGSRALETRVELLLFDAIEETAENASPERDLLYLAGTIVSAMLLPHLLEGYLLEFHCWVEWMLV
jgi:Zn-dependent protease with chaperone function